MEYRRTTIFDYIVMFLIFMTSLLTFSGCHFPTESSTENADNVQRMLDYISKKYPDEEFHLSSDGKLADYCKSDDFSIYLTCSLKHPVTVRLRVSPTTSLGEGEKQYYLTDNYIDCKYYDEIVEDVLAWSRDNFHAKCEIIEKGMSYSTGFDADTIYESYALDSDLELEVVVDGASMTSVQKAITKLSEDFSFVDKIKFWVVVSDDASALRSIKNVGQSVTHTEDLKDAEFSDLLKDRVTKDFLCISAYRDNDYVVEDNDIVYDRFLKGLD